MTAPAIPQKATRREWIGLLVLAFPCFLLSVDFTVLHLAVPRLTADLRPSTTQLLWIVDIYGFLIASSLITMGTLGDRIGRRKLLLIGAATFGLASVAAAFATNAATLIATRAILGVAGATLMPSTMALIRNLFHDADERRIAIAVWINSFVIGGSIGPIIGGVVLEHFWWGAVFLINVPVMVALLILGPLLLPESQDPDAGAVDLLSAAMSLVAMLLVIYAIKRFAQDGFTPLPVFAAIAGVIGWILFILRQRHLEHPLIDVELFKVPAFSTSVATQLIATVTLGGMYFLVAQYLQLVLGLDPLRAGLALLPATVTGFVGTVVAPILVKRHSHAQLITSGMILTAIGMLVLSQLEPASGLTLLVGAYMIMTFGINVAITLTTDNVMSVAPPERAGAASGISETSAELGAALGIAIIGSIAAAAYRNHMIAAIGSSGVPAVAAHAHSTLAVAVAAAREIGGAAGVTVLNAARASFTAALSLAALLSAIAISVISVISALVLRRSREA
jgi:DHA2 family multidrug resistance protein-like MFS transporter